MLGLEDVEPLPVPKSPAMMQEMPSVKMPLRNKHGRAGANPTLPQHPWDAAVRVRYRGGEKSRLYLLMACTGGGGAPASRAQE